MSPPPRPLNAHEGNGEHAPWERVVQLGQFWAQFSFTVSAGALRRDIIEPSKGAVMKITIDEQPSARNIAVTITCPRTSRQVLDIVARLRMFDRKVTGSTNGSTHVISAEDILYVESVDKKTFFYTDDAVYETPLRLYEMEERLADCDFLRVAKGCVVNFRKIASLRPDINGRILATMDNEEQVVISRQYAPDVKHKLGLL